MAVPPFQALIHSLLHTTPLYQVSVTQHLSEVTLWQVLLALADAVPTFWTALVFSSHD